MNTSDTNKKMSGFAVMRRLIVLVKPMTGYMVLAILAGLSGHLLATFLTIFGAYAVLSVLGVSSIPLALLFGILIGSAILRGILRYAEQTCNHFIAFKLLALIRGKVFGSLRRLCPAKLEVKDRGNLINIITSDIEMLEVFYAHTISPVFIATLFSIIMAIFIGSYNVILGIIAAIAYITVGVILPISAGKRNSAGAKFKAKSGQLSSFVLESLRGLPELLQYGQGKVRLQEMNSRSDSLSKEEESIQNNSSQNMALTNTLILLFDIAMLVASSMLSGFEGAVITTIALMSSFGPTIALSALGGSMQKIIASGNRVIDILDESPVTEDVSGKSEVSFEVAEAENVNFSYGDELILSDVSIKTDGAGVIGITGRSGSGKSTLLKLFMRFWSVGSGEIKISERSVEEINTDNLRDIESFLTQETHLFHDSIKNNLRIAKLDATDEEIIEACKKASIHEFITSLPKGYDTPVGELGDTLSGGERQRLGLAQAFLHDAPFMMLDEPTSNLDSLNEGVILKSLNEECNDKTVILVSHRKSTMGIAKKVYSVEHGRIS